MLGLRARAAPRQHRNQFRTRLPVILSDIEVARDPPFGASPNSLACASPEQRQVIFTRRLPNSVNMGATRASLGSG